MRALTDVPNETPAAAAARVGIGGPVGSGKTALIEALIPELQRRGINFAVVTNDLVTKEDAERLRRSGLIDPKRVSAVEAGACPHTVIREDPTLNIAAGDDLEACISGARTGSGLSPVETIWHRRSTLDLVDWWMFVIDVAGGDDIPRKRGPGLIRSDLLVVDRGRSAPYVKVNLDAMFGGGPHRTRPASRYRHQCTFRSGSRGRRRCNCRRSPFRLPRAWRKPGSRLM